VHRKKSGSPTDHLGTSGVLYGASSAGGEYGAGTVFQLTQSGGQWTEQVLHSFNPQTEDTTPMGGLTIDQSGNLYGSTYSYGSIFQLAQSNGAWTFNTIHQWSDIDGPLNMLGIDAQGNLYGYIDSIYLFEVAPSDGSWVYTTLYGFGNGRDGQPAVPTGVPVIDASGNIYGESTAGGEYDLGTIWEYTP
jgi:uncharacterized repeat protein (TIGR03803 family)